jgi:hypothetical protein
MDKQVRIDQAEKIATATDGKVWTKEDGDVVRVYIGKGFAQVNDDGVNIDRVPGNKFPEAKAACEAMGVRSYRK